MKFLTINGKLQKDSNGKLITLADSGSQTTGVPIVLLTTNNNHDGFYLTVDFENKDAYMALAEEYIAGQANIRVCYNPDSASRYKNVSDITKAEDLRYTSNGIKLYFFDVGNEGYNWIEIKPNYLS